MIRTVEGIIDEHGHVRLIEPVQLAAARRALIIILDERPSTGTSDDAFLSEAALAHDWDRAEEDEAWAHFQPVR